MVRKVGNSCIFAGGGWLSHLADVGLLGMELTGRVNVFIIN